MHRTILSLSLAAGLAVVSTASLAAKPCPAPEVFAPGVISLPGQWEWRLTLSPDRTVALWSAGNLFGGERTTILLSVATKRGWSTPVVAPFSGTDTDLDPFFSPDGSTVYFSSMRPLEAGGAPRPDFELWRVAVEGNGFGTPEHLGAGPNSDADELYPSIDRAGNLYFGSSRDGGQWDVWRSARGADGTFAAAEKLGDGVNTPDYWEFNPEISPNGRTLLFVSLFRPDGFGFGDIYRSDQRRDEGFQPARNLGPCVNSSADDYHPTMLWDEGELLYIRNVIEDPNWYPDFFVVPLRLE